MGYDFIVDREDDENESVEVFGDSDSSEGSNREAVLTT